MKKKSLSTLGYIMNRLNIQTVSMSRAIHVDASLISKWRTGDRNLSGKSIYFDDVIVFLMEQSTRTFHHVLKNSLLDLYPHEKIEDNDHLESLLRQALSHSQAPKSTFEQQMLAEGSNTIQAMIFEGTAGRRDAISRLLDYAEAMTTPGEIVFVDTEEFKWLLEDAAFTEQFIKRIESLLHKDFHAKFVIHYSPYKDRFVQLFEACSLLIFHRNIDWYYYEYYDENIINFSFFILNRAISLLGFSAETTTSSTMVFTNNTLVIQHELLAKHVIEQCNPLFTKYELPQILEVTNDLLHFHKKGACYSYLPVPAFITVREDLLQDILTENNVPSEKIHNCLELNKKLRSITSNYFSKQKSREPFVYIFQLEEMLRRARNKIFISRSLTLFCRMPIQILPHHYAQELRNLVEMLEDYNNLKIVLVSEKDSFSLPSINCWCKQNTWMLQMNAEGFRISDEPSMVNAATATLERCIHKIPTERKDKISISQYLLELAEELEEEETFLEHKLGSKMHLR